MSGDREMFALASLWPEDGDGRATAHLSASRQKVHGQPHNDRRASRPAG